MTRFVSTNFLKKKFVKDTKFVLCSVFMRLYKRSLVPGGPAANSPNLIKKLLLLFLTVLKGNCWSKGIDFCSELEKDFLFSNVFLFYRIGIIKF